jgi:TMEM175 potassium channel family protein
MQYVDGWRWLTRGAGDDRLVAAGEPEFESRAVDRLTFFSDAVVAIAITLLAIDLPVPGGDTVAELWTSVQHNDGHYAAFLISFAVIAGAWSNHHELFRYVKRADSRLRAFNTAWLLMIVLNPFATRMLTTKGQPTLDAHALRFGFYALLQLLASVALFAMLQHMISHRQAPDAPPLAVTNMAWASYGAMLGFGLSIPVFFATTHAWLLWIIIPLLVARLRRLRRWNRRSPEAS